MWIHFTRYYRIKMLRFTIYLIITFAGSINGCHEDDLGAYHKDPHYDGERSVIVHLFEWKFKDIAKECEDFLGPYGYGGVQVSPVSESMVLPERPWFERYQPLSYEINSRSGTEKEFQEMVQRCNKAGVRIYVDVIANHMTWNNDNAVGTGGSKAEPNEKSYPTVGYTSADFHTTCKISNYNNATEVRICELGGLHDLDQSLAKVREKLINFINKLIDYGIAGIRVGAAKHMEPEDLKYIYSKLNQLNREYFPCGSKLFIYQEVIDYGHEAIKATEYTGYGRVTDFRYGSELSRAFDGKNHLKWLRNWGEEWKLLKHDDSLVFIDNHDNQRGSGAGGFVLTHKQSKQYKMAVAFMLAWKHGEPRVMSSYYFNHKDHGPPQNEDGSIKDVTYNPDMTCGNGWVCEHRWRQIYNMVKFHNVVEGSKVHNWWDNGKNQIAFCRGNDGFIVFNGDPFPLEENLQTCMPAGKYCDIISGCNKEGVCTGKVVTVDEKGFAKILIPSDEGDSMVAITSQSITEHKST